MTRSAVARAGSSGAGDGRELLGDTDPAEDAGGLVVEGDGPGLRVGGGPPGQGLETRPDKAVGDLRQSGNANILGERHTAGMNIQNFLAT